MTKTSTKIRTTMQLPNLRLSVVAKKAASLGVATASILIAPHASATQMFCPRANFVIQTATGGNPDAPEKLTMTASADRPTSFPRSSAAIGLGEGDLQTMGLILTDCSNAKFFCKSVNMYGTKDHQPFVIVVPRVVRPAREYEYRGVRMVTRLAAYSSQANRNAITITLWQLIGNKEIPMELTVEEGRGLTYWDGIKWDQDAPGAGEMCVLTPKLGLFSSVSIKAK